MTAPVSDLPAPPDSPLLFDAVLRPHRSLNRAGFIALMTVVVIVNVALSVFFWLKGAWPIFAFCGADIVLVYGAFKLNYRAGRLRETLQLGRELVVTRMEPSGEVKTWTFQPNWLQVTMDNPPEPSSLFVISSHGRRLAIGVFLPAEERLEVAKALREALRRWKQPSVGVTA